MKKLIYLLLIVVGSFSMTSCGASSKSCVSSEYQIKNIKFQNQHVVLTDEFIQTEDKVH